MIMCGMKFTLFLAIQRFLVDATFQKAIDKTV